MKDHPLRQILHELGMTQAKFAVLTDVTQAVVSMTCRGHLRTPKRILETIEELGYDTGEYKQKEEAFHTRLRLLLKQQAKKRRIERGHYV